MKIKHQNTDKLSGTMKSGLKNEPLLKSTYSFQLKHRQVTVSFSDNPGAPTLENALVKIATRQID